MRMNEITQTRVHYGYRRVHVLLRREGFKDNHKRIYIPFSTQGIDLLIRITKAMHQVATDSPRSDSPLLDLTGECTNW
jgi:putative transposase